MNEAYLRKGLEAKKRPQPEQPIGQMHRSEIDDFFVRHEKKFRGGGWHIEVDPERSPLVDAAGFVYGLPVVCEPLDSEDDESQHAWITCRIQPETIDYVFSLNNQIIESRKPTKQETFEEKQRIDQSSKKVTARGPGTYPGQLLLLYDEVWPKDSDIVVVGDPYQLCDFDRTTIIDYEFADEIVPNIKGIIEELRAGNMDANQVMYRLQSFFEDLHMGDEFAIKMLYGGYVSNEGNPYSVLLRKCMQTVANGLVEYANGNTAAGDQVQASVHTLQAEYIKLRRGEWKQEEYIDQIDDTPEAKESLKLFFKLKEISCHPNPKAWADYKDAWSRFFDQIPPEYAALEEIHSLTRRVRYWLDQLPQMSAAVPERAEKGLNETINAYREIQSRLANIPEVKAGTMEIPHVSEIMDVRSTGLMSDSPFGVATPGMPLNRRVDKYLGEAVDFVNRMGIYLRNILPAIENESARITKLGVPIEQHTKFALVSKLEQGLIHEQLHRKRTQRSVVLNGFFPETANLADPKDRIIALYSVSTHVWESYNSPDQFACDIKAALAFLKPGGKYILGPINYAAYHVWFREGEVPSEMAQSFDGNSLREACQSLKEEGKMEYYFTKIDDSGEIVDSSEFETGNIAGSLVITKL